MEFHKTLFYYSENIFPLVSKHIHTKNPCDSNKNVYYCSQCGALIISKNQSQISTIKPIKYDYKAEFDPLYAILKNESVIKFEDKKSYLQLRSNIIREMKQFASENGILLKTFFYAVSYLDIICSKLTKFTYEYISTIAKLCIVISEKFCHNVNNGFLLENKFQREFSSEYRTDEIFIIKLLNYRLFIITPYDIILQLVKSGFIFEDEVFEVDMHLFYKSNSHISMFIYAFCETDFYISFSFKTIAFGIIGFVRELIGLNAFSNNLLEVFELNNEKKIYKVKKVLDIIKRMFSFIIKEEKERYYKS